MSIAPASSRSMLLLAGEGPWPCALAEITANQAAAAAATAAIARTILRD
jgi:hypothetical protein